MIAAGGAERDRRASRLTNDAIIAAGKCLSKDIGVRTITNTTERETLTLTTRMFHSDGRTLLGT